MLAEVDLSVHDVPGDLVPVAKRKPYLMMDTFFPCLMESEATHFAARLTGIAWRMEMKMTLVEPALAPCMHARLALRQ